jgi:hypothetical protein
MQPFLHGRKQTLEPLLQQANAVLVKYTRNDPGFTDALEEFLGEAANVFESAGASKLQNEFLALSSNAASARQGINPYTLERVSVRRRTMQRSVGQRVLTHAAELLRNETEKCENAIGESRARLMPLLLSVLQRGLFELPAAPPSQSQLTGLWELLLMDSETRTNARHLAMTTSTPDIHILLGDLIAALQT